MRRFRPTPLRPVRTACALLLLLSCLLTAPLADAEGDAHAQDPPTPALEKVLNEALRRRREYVETFKDLTAEETKLTEVFEEGGAGPSKRREEVSDFLVYQSQIDEKVVNEYRAVRVVDGKAVGRETERAEKLFARLARASTLETEWKRLREENLRYTLKFYRWNVTLHPAPQLEEGSRAEYDYELAGRERLGGRETLVLSYSRKSLRPAKATGILKEFKDPHIGDRGRLWLDAETSQIQRWENEHVVRHAQTGRVIVYLRDEVDYVGSPFGILVPKRIVASFFNRLRYRPGVEEGPRTELGGRITYTYGPFKRFDVKTGYEVNPAKGG